jgi:hypothetical protein
MKGYMKNRYEHEVVLKQLFIHDNENGYTENEIETFIFVLSDLELLQLTNKKLIKLHCIPLTVDEILKHLNS